MPLDTLIILSHLREERRMTTADLAADIQKTETSARGTLERLVEAGLVDAHGTGRGRTYTLSAKVYQHCGQKAAYIRQVGFDPIQQEQMVLSFIDKHGSIKRADAAELCHTSLPQAYHLLKKMQREGRIIQKGKMRHALYTRDT